MNSLLEKMFLIFGKTLYCLKFFFLGHVLVQEVACTSKREDPLQWLPALRHLEAALELCTTSVTRELDLEAEIFFQKGGQNPGCIT